MDQVCIKGNNNQNGKKDNHICFNLIFNSMLK